MNEEQRSLTHMYMELLRMEPDKLKDDLYCYRYIEGFVQGNGSLRNPYDYVASLVKPSFPSKAEENNGDAVRAGIRRVQKRLRDTMGKEAGDILGDKDIIDDTPKEFIEYIGNRILRGDKPCPPKK